MYFINASYSYNLYLTGEEPFLTLFYIFIIKIYVFNFA